MFCLPLQGYFLTAIQPHYWIAKDPILQADHGYG